MGLLALTLAVASAACGDDSGGTGAAGTGGSGGGTQSSTGAGAGSPDQTGAKCESADECYPGVADGALSGDAICLDKAIDGYCTHACTGDDDCCGAEGECTSGLSQVCSPFESTGMNMCFLSCEKGDVGDRDADEYCQFEAGRDFQCRSSGGGSSNRKICFPGTCGAGASCTVNGDCAAGLTCVTSLLGGYCSEEGCATTADCPADTRCVARAGGAPNVCLRTCAGASDCSFCRGAELAAACTDEADFVDGTAETVCVPAEG